MFSSKTIRMTKTCTSINSLFITFFVILLINITGMCKASAEEKPSLWTYNNEKTDKPTNLQGIQSSLKKIQNTMDDIQSQIAPLLKKCESFSKADPEVQKALKSLGEEYEARQKQIKELEKKIAEFKAALESTSKENVRNSQSVEELQNKLKEAERVYNELKERKSKLLEDVANYEKQLNGRSVNKPAVDMTPVYVLIYDNCIVPVEEPYYKFEGVLQVYNGRIVQVTKVTRVKDGEPISEAIKPGGCLDSLLKVDPAKQYVMFLVCPDSISAFRIAVGKMKESNIRYAWSPGQDSPLYGTKGVPSDWPVNPEK